MKLLRLLIAFTTAVAASVYTMESAYADIATDAVTQCAGCHQLQPGDRTDLKARAQRKGPPLYYAGNKFHKEWLVSWLQKPTRIRPAGDFPPDHVKTTEHGDVVDRTTLHEHLALDATNAQRFADWLMTLTARKELVAAESYKPGRVSKRMGAMNFRKFKGCGACHQDAEGKGGLSGPELYTAWQRMQTGFIASYIRNPAAWEPVSLMPVKHLQTKQINQIVDYLHVISKGAKQ